jgi:DNA modification methylase
MTPYYEHAGITLYHADWRECDLGHHDLLLTDPPYGINADRDRNCAKNGWVDYGSTGWDAAPASDEDIEKLHKLAKVEVVWGGNYFVLPPSMGWLVWDKGQRDFSLADGELAWTNRKLALRIFTMSRSLALQDGKQHPTQKPLALMKWCISLVPSAKTLVDPYAGSGTSLVAAKHMGLKATGVEREERYCEIIAKRLSQEVMDFGEV